MVAVPPPAGGPPPSCPSSSTPSKAAARSASPVSAPGAPRPTPPTYVPGLGDVPWAAATVPLVSPRRQYEIGVPPRTVCGYAASAAAGAATTATSTGATSPSVLRRHRWALPDRIPRRMAHLSTGAGQGSHSHVRDGKPAQAAT